MCTALAVLFCNLAIHLHQQRKQSMRQVAGEEIKLSKPFADSLRRDA
jgi:hypothetical protein